VIELYTVEQVLALAPDASSVKSGKELSSERKWLSLGTSTQAIWGECQGSGSQPYQTRIDLRGPAFKCSCPSRKFPCKHGLGLFLLRLNKKEAFQEATPPSWVGDWLASRDEAGQRKEKREAKQLSPEELQASLQSKEKRKLDRLAQIDSGIEELELFLQDLVSGGIASLKTKPYSYFGDRAARLVDAQAPGLAKMLRRLGTACGAVDYQDRFLSSLADIYTLVSAYKNRESLPAPLRQDVIAAIGIPQSQEELLKQEGIKDIWLTVGQYSYSEDKLKIQKTYLWGLTSGKTALILSFAHGLAPFDTMLVPGHFYDATLVFFPSNEPLRALIKERTGGLDRSEFPQAGLSIGDAMTQFAASLARIPFAETKPTLLAAVHVTIADDKFILHDRQSSVPLKIKDLLGWQLVAFSSGKPLSIFGEWDGYQFQALCAIKRSSFMKLAYSGDI
jgi:hypothetical protein